MLHFPPPPHLHAMHGAPPPMPPPITSIAPHMVPVNQRQMLHHQYQTTLARRQLRQQQQQQQQQVSNGVSDVAAYDAAETTPICRCRVIYLGSSVPHVTKDGLQGIQEPLRDLYPEQGLLASATTESIGIDSWLSVWSNGILIENVDDSGREMKKFFPIDSLHYCAAVRYVVIPGGNIDSSSTVASASSNTVSGVTNGLDSHHNKSSFNGDAVASNATSDASELIASTGTSQHVQQHRSPTSASAAAAAAAASSSSSHGQNGQNAPAVATDAKIKFLPLDSPFSRNSNTSIHPPLFACILRRTTGIKVLECHAFICKRDQAANALVRCCFHAYADSMHAKQMEAEIDNEQAESTYGAISVSDRRSRRSHALNGHSSNSPDGPSGDSLVDGSPNYRASSSSSSNAQVNGKSRPSARENTRHHKRSMNGSTMSNGQGSIHLNDATANRFSRSISDLDSVENKIEAWRQRSTEALNMEAQQQQQQQQQQKSSAVEAEIHTESPCSRLTRSRRALSSGAIAVQGTTLAEYRRRRSDDQYSDEEVEAIVDDEDDDEEVENESAPGPKRVNGNRNHIEGVYDNLDDEEDEVDEDEDGNYKVWHSRGRRGTDSGVGGVRSSESTIADAAPSIRSARYPLSGGGASLMYGPAAVSTPHLASLPANHPMYHHPGHFIHFNGHRGTIARSAAAAGHMAPMPGHLTLAPFPFGPPAHHPAYLMDGRATLRSVRTTASSRAPTHFASGTLNRPASVATSRSMTNLAPTGPILSPPPFFSPHGSPFFPVPSTLSKKELKNLKNTMKKLKKKSKSSKAGDHFVPFSPAGPHPPPGHPLGPPPHPMMRPLPPSHPMALPPPPFANSNGHPHPHSHPHAHGHPAYAMAMHPSGRPMPMLMLPHSPPPPPPPPHGHMLMQDEPIYVPTLRPMTPISIIPDSSVYNGALRNPKKDNNKLILNGTSKNGAGKNSSKESSSSHRNSSSPGESISASGSKNNLLHQNYPSVHHSSSNNNRRCQVDSSSEQEVHSDSSGFNTGGIYRKKANLNERAFSYSIRQESRSRSNSIANVNFPPPHSLGSGEDEDSPASLAINGDSYSSTASSSLHNAMQRHSLINSSGVSSINGGGMSKSHLSSNERQQQQQQMNYYNKQNGHKYANEEITEDLENLTLNGGYKANGGAVQAEMYYQQAQMMHSTGRNGYHDSSHDGSKMRQAAAAAAGGGGGGGNRCDSSLSSSTLQGNVKTASIKRGSGLSLHQLHASIASNGGGGGGGTSGSKIALTPVPPIPPHLLANVNGNHSTNGNTSAGHMNGSGSKVNSRSSSRENL